jgi:hypothetical protein
MFVFLLGRRNFLNVADCDLESKQWARKRFIEAYIRYGELQQEQFLLPDGELKNLLADVAQTKALPVSVVTFEELHKRGMAYSKETRTAKPRNAPAPAPKPVPVVDVGAGSKSWHAKPR